MNIKHLFHNLALVVFGCAMAIALSYVHAEPYNGPTCSAPSCDTATPINVGTTDQVKLGGLWTGGLAAFQNAQFGGKTYLQSSLTTSSSNGTIAFGGTDLNQVLHKVSLAISGTLNNTGTIASTPLANTVSGAVCADATGTVVLCDAGAVTPPSESKPEFLATGGYGYYTGYTGFTLGTWCAGGVAPDYTYPDIYVFSCGSNVNHDSGAGSPYGRVMKLDLRDILYNGIPGVNSQNGDIIVVSSTKLPPPFWTVQQTGDYAVSFTGSGTIESIARDGGFFTFFGFFLQVNNQKYPLTSTPSNVGVNTPVVGYHCGPGESHSRLADFGSPINLFSSITLPIDNSEIQYAAAGSCLGAHNSWQNGNWTTPLAYNLNFSQTLHLNAGDKVYLYGKLGGAAFKDQSGQYYDPRDVDVHVVQGGTNTLHIVQQ